MENLLSTGQVAKILNKSVEMVRNYIKQGKLIPDSKTGNKSLFKKETIRQFQKENKNGK